MKKCSMVIDNSVQSVSTVVVAGTILINIAYFLDPWHLFAPVQLQNIAGHL